MASLPTALRTIATKENPASAFLVSMSALLVPVLVMLALAPVSARGLRQLLGTESPKKASRTVAMWIALVLPTIAGVGAYLKHHTHHRGLAGTTFAVLALATLGGAALAAKRTGEIAEWAANKGLSRNGLRIAGWVVASAVCAALIFPIAKPSATDAEAVLRADVVDGAIVVMAALLAGSIDLSASTRRIGRLIAVPASVIVLVAGVLRVESSPPLARGMRGAGGLPAAILWALEQWTDRDHDGHGAHFGGDDCDEGDPSRHGGAVEIAGDGIDQDCDGFDPPKATQVLVAAEVADAGAAQPPPAAHTDIVLVTLDSARADHMSLYGYDKATTPKLAEIARGGVVFDHAYAAGGDLPRALVPLVSGKHFSDTPHDRRELPTILPQTDTLAERLGASGYKTVAVSSFKGLSEDRGFAQGFNVFRPVYQGLHPEREVTGPAAVKAAIEAWRSLEAATDPIFLWVHLYDAHERYLEHPGIDFGTGKAAAYDGELCFVDQQVGELWAGIGSSPRASQVAWIVHGLIGEGLGEHDFFGHPGELNEEALRVPLLMVVPRAKPGRYTKDAVSTLDLPRTITELAGASGDGFVGTSLASIAKGNMKTPHGPVFARASGRAALVDWPLKLILIERPTVSRAYLYDLAIDPAERHDLSKTRLEDVDRLVREQGAFDLGAQ